MNGQAEQPDKEIPDDSEITGDAQGSVDDVLATDDAVDAAENDSEETEVEVLQAKADEHWNKYLRAVAELENIRKRATRDVENARRYALERFSKELLAVRDSLEMGIASADTGSVESLMEGSQATLKLLTSTMTQFGVEQVDPAGEPFDPDFHEAISMQPSDDVEPGSVVNVVQCGYTLNGRLLRPAMVVVAAE